MRGNEGYMMKNDEIRAKTGRIIVEDLKAFRSTGRNAP